MAGRQVLVLLLAIVLVASVHAAAEVTDEQRLAILAGKMLNLTQPGKDYAMDCGPGDEVLNLQAQETDLTQEPYCVLNTSGRIIFGTFGDPDTKIPELIRVYNDTAYRSQVQIKDVNPKACEAVADNDIGNGFTECPGAIRYTINGVSTNLYTYAYTDDMGSGVTYIIVSERGLSSLQGSGFWPGLSDAVSGFFKRFFGWL